MRLKALIDRERSLHVCADIANGWKHLRRHEARKKIVAPTRRARARRRGNTVWVHRAIASGSRSYAAADLQRLRDAIDSA